MRRESLTILLAALALASPAQRRFTDQLQRAVAGQGKVTLHQSRLIADLVDGVGDTLPAATRGPEPRPARPAGQAAARAARDTGDTLAPDTVAPRGPVARVSGYRVQVYSGDNTRKSKNEAYMMGQRVKTLFEELPVYIHFSSPHWTCRAGNFRTYEEAGEALRQLRATGRFGEAVIVRSKVQVTL